MQSVTLDQAFESWGSYDLDDPFPLFSEMRERGPVHPVTLADGHSAWLVVSFDEAMAALNDHASFQGHARRNGHQLRGRRRGPARS